MADLITADPIDVDTNEEIVMGEDADVDIEDLDDKELEAELQKFIEFVPYRNSDGTVKLTGAGGWITYCLITPNGSTPSTGSIMTTPLTAPHP